ncbi:MAG: alpha/beta fold hydrolase [Patescibacteria group bacterium]|nr:alpha/beta fold hydrolase [Patescibacteria group bacterium]MCX7589493.1 alpha/beta fold hydrolase [Patescibacteria group bacterium]MDW8280028.1 alpha/beta fold hydrolase [bacterium]
MEKVVLKTEDGLDIVGDYYDLSIEKRGVLLLHMMPKDRKSWWDLAIKLEDEGFKVLAIDLRGHGESIGGPEGYKNFSDEEHQKSILDIQAGIDFLKFLGIDLENIVLGGASIGANLALQYASMHSKIKKVFCLSPGLNYRGIKPLEFITNFNSSHNILIASSLDDVYGNGLSNANDCQIIFENIPKDTNKKLIIYEAAGHGTDMFFANKENEPDLIQEIIKWIKT